MPTSCDRWPRSTLRERSIGGCVGWGWMGRCSMCLIDRFWRRRSGDRPAGSRQPAAFSQQSPRLISKGSAPRRDLTHNPGSSAARPTQGYETSPRGGRRLGELTVHRRLRHTHYSIRIMPPSALVSPSSVPPPSRQRTVSQCVGFQSSVISFQSEKSCPTSQSALPCPPSLSLRSHNAAR